jgi:UDP-N-acetylmuramyl pentapeptide phosphotransferase/UDP-N-acetylglucosamine-1-phosphate transferase
VIGLSSSWIVLASVSFVVSFAVVWLIERHAVRLGLVDLPNVRSSHRTPRPRGGGAGIVLGVAIALAIALAKSIAVSPESWTLLAAALVLALLGLWDDVSTLGVWPRLAVQILAAVVVVGRLGGIDRLPLPPPLDVPLGPAAGVLTVVWLVGVTNFFNFMDGVDGLAGGQAVISLGVLAWALRPDAAAGVALLVLAGTAAFLIRNWSPARIFLGDVGSAFLGFLLAGLPLAAPPGSRPQLVFVAAISLSLFLLDPVATLIARRRRRDGIGKAHREHAYQQLVEPGAPHAGAVTALLGVGLALTLLAALAYDHPALAWLTVAVALAAFAVEWQIAGRRRRRGPDPARAGETRPPSVGA